MSSVRFPCRFLRSSVVDLLKDVVICGMFHYVIVDWVAMPFFSIRMSLFLFRKILPSDPPDLDSYLRMISKGSPEPDPRFMDFVRQEVPRLFRRGWDSRLYSDAALSSTLSTSACVENQRKFGGCRGWYNSGNSSILGRESFIESVLTTTRPPLLPPSNVRSVWTGGKWRIVSVPGFDMGLLKPLHTAMYNHLSKFSWLLRGDAKATKFKDFRSNLGEVFVSGDYESATDNLNQGVQKEILRLVLQNSDQVPQGIRLLAMRSMSLDLTDGLNTVHQSSGQMMGNLLSFPLLCLVNYLSFKYSIRREVPLRINGDDIVFRARPEEYELWKKNINLSGLVLSSGKTMVDSRYFTVNSCLFKSLRRGSKSIPFIRSKAFFDVLRDRDSLHALSGRFFSFCPGFRGSRKAALQVRWLRENRPVIEGSLRSLTRGLGLPLKLGVIMDAGMWDREAWYLSLEAERPLPMPFSEWQRRPAGFVYHRVEKITKEIKEEQKLVANAFVEGAWLPPLDRDDTSLWNEKLREGCFNWSDWSYQRSFGSLKRAKLLGLSHQNAKRYLRPSRLLFDRSHPRLIRYGVWRQGSSPIFERTYQELGVPLGPKEFNFFAPPAALCNSRIVNSDDMI
nr:MAG: RNA-dependent RNA polymerase [Sjack associated botourmia-like virus 20]